MDVDIRRHLFHHFHSTKPEISAVPQSAYNSRWRHVKRDSPYLFPQPSYLLYSYLPFLPLSRSIARWRHLTSSGHYFFWPECRIRVSELRIWQMRNWRMELWNGRNCLSGRKREIQETEILRLQNEEFSSRWCIEGLPAVACSWVGVKASLGKLIGVQSLWSRTIGAFI